MYVNAPCLLAQGTHHYVTDLLFEHNALAQVCLTWDEFSRLYSILGLRYRGTSIDRDQIQLAAHTAERQKRRTGGDLETTSSM